MKRYHVQLCSAAAFAVLVLAAPSASADDRCARPNGSIEQRACAMAAAGPETLRRFIERTRGIYQLYYFDFVPSER